MEPLTRTQVLKGIGAAALFVALVALGFMLVDLEVRHQHPGKPDAEVVLPLVPEVPWR